MTDMALTLPYARVSPLYIPRRDLVVSSADSIRLSVTVLENDDPAALPITLTGGIGGPACLLVVWPDRRWQTWDYGWGAGWGAQLAGPATALWTGVGTVDAANPGTFDIFVPALSMNTWPLRCRWGVMFDQDGGDDAEMLAHGYLHVRPMVSRSIIPTILLTDPTPAVLTDPEVDAIFVNGFINGTPPA